MPTVLLTGANGFLATHVLKELVDNSFEVVGTVRSEAKANDVFAAHPDFKNRVRLVAVPNMSSPGAYDKILKETQFDYVIHTASPVPDGAGTDFDKDFLEPAVQGNLELFRAAHKYAKSLKHLTFTGSMVTVYDVMGPYDGRVLKSTDWNPVDTKVAVQMQHPAVSYVTCKTLAEKALWDFVENEKPSFAVTVLSVPVILGPPVQYVGQGSIAKGHTNMSSDLFYNAFLRPNPPADATPSLYNGYIDVRDLAKLHVRSVVESGGKSSRLLLTSPEPFFAHTALEILNRRFPQLQNRLKSVLAVRIVANKEQDLEHPLRVDDSEAKALFGNNIYRSFEDTVVDTTTRLLEIEN